LSADDATDYRVMVANEAGGTWAVVKLSRFEPRWDLGKTLDFESIPWAAAAGMFDFEYGESVAGESSIRLTVSEAGERREMQARMVGTGELRFYVKRAFPGEDAVFEVRVDGEPVMTLRDDTSGSWEKVRVPITRDGSLVRLVLRKPGRLSQEDYRVWIDAMDWLSDRLSFVQQPSGGDFALGGVVRLAARATGARPIRYRWYHDGALVEGADGPVLEIEAAQAGDAGRYWVVASNDAESLRSDYAWVRLI
ncbi:MAG: hypothetical protein D6781_14735, partial [Verrucomicrobia bacterium]